MGDLFEQLLNKGFKQNEGQFFTPMPITRFIWDSLPLDKILHSESGGYRLPKVIDYACGAGHFLTEAVEAINEYMCLKDCAEQVEDNRWVEKCIYGVEKDYRLARVAKVSLHMNGAGKGQIIFGDGLEQYVEKGIVNGTFDILVANPPYSVDAFKAHLKLKNNSFEILPLITNTGDSIETLFVERISQLLRPTGIAAVVLPSSILSNDSGSYIAAREQILQNFFVRAISQFGSKTFGATGTNTVVLFLEKYNEPPKRKEQINDSVEAILSNNVSAEWEDKAIFDAYLQRISVSESDYVKFLSKELQFEQMQEISYFKECIEIFNVSAQLKALISKKSYKSLTPLLQEKEKLDLFYKQQFISERDKLYYFALVYKQNTLIITAPQSNDEQKRFLGYDWSNRRGSEGIQINSPGGMLYNAENRFSAGTLAAAVRHSYNDLQPQIPERQEYYTFARLQDMIEFARPVFNKAIKTSVDKQIVIRSKYPVERLERLLLPIEGEKTKISETEMSDSGNIPVVTQEANRLIAGYTNSGAPITDLPLIVFGDHNCSYKYVDFPFVRGADGTQLIKINGKVNLKYLYNYLLTIELENHSKYERHFKYLKGVQVPIPPKEIQEQIVSECQKVDDEYNTSRMTIDEYRNKMRQVFESLEIIGGG